MSARAPAASTERNAICLTAPQRLERRTSRASRPLEREARHSGLHRTSCMRAEAEQLVEDIKQSVGLLRRHL